MNDPSVEKEGRWRALSTGKSRIDEEEEESEMTLVGDEAGLIDRIVGMSDAEAKGAYEDFESGRCGKVLFDPWRV